MSHKNFSSTFSWKKWAHDYGCKILTHVQVDAILFCSEIDSLIYGILGLMFSFGDICKYVKRSVGVE